MYRGMHHLSDVVVGLVIGLVSLSSPGASCAPVLRHDLLRRTRRAQAGDDAPVSVVDVLTGDELAVLHLEGHVGALRDARGRG